MDKLPGSRLDHEARGTELICHTSLRGYRGAGTIHSSAHGMDQALRGHALKKDARVVGSLTT
jgi:hypothetical protein